MLLLPGPLLFRIRSKVCVFVTIKTGKLEKDVTLLEVFTSGVAPVSLLFFVVEILCAAEVFYLLAYFTDLDLLLLILVKRDNNGEVPLLSEQRILI